MAAPAPAAAAAAAPITYIPESEPWEVETESRMKERLAFGAYMGAGESQIIYRLTNDFYEIARSVKGNQAGIDYRAFARAKLFSSRLMSGGNGDMFRRTLTDWAMMEGEWVAHRLEFREISILLAHTRAFPLSEPLMAYELRQIAEYDKMKDELRAELRRRDALLDDRRNLAASGLVDIMARTGEKHLGQIVGQFATGFINKSTPLAIRQHTHISFKEAEERAFNASQLAELDPRDHLLKEELQMETYMASLTSRIPTIWASDVPTKIQIDTSAKMMVARLRVEAKRKQDASMIVSSLLARFARDPAMVDFVMARCPRPLLVYLIQHVEHIPQNEEILSAWMKRQVVSPAAERNKEWLAANPLYPDVEEEDDYGGPDGISFFLKPVAENHPTYKNGIVVHMRDNEPDRTGYEYNKSLITDWMLQHPGWKWTNGRSFGPLAHYKAYPDGHISDNAIGSDQRPIGSLHSPPAL